MYVCTCTRPGKKKGSQVARILFLLLLTTSAWPCLKNSRNLGTILLPGSVLDYFLPLTAIANFMTSVCLPLNWFSPETPPSLLYSTCASPGFSRSFTISAAAANDERRRTIGRKEGRIHPSEGDGGEGAHSRSCSVLLAHELARSRRHLQTRRRRRCRLSASAATLCHVRKRAGGSSPSFLPSFLPSFHPALASSCLKWRKGASTL